MWSNNFSKRVSWFFVQPRFGGDDSSSFVGQPFLLQQLMTQKIPPRDLFIRIQIFTRLDEFSTPVFSFNNEDSTTSNNQMINLGCLQLLLPIVKLACGIKLDIVQQEPSFRKFGEFINYFKLGNCTT
jgi:hypothetical protein